MYRIRHTKDYRLYWSNVDGWVDRQSSHLFNDEEQRVCNLPIDGEWLISSNCIGGTTDRRNERLNAMPYNVVTFEAAGRTFRIEKGKVWNFGRMFTEASQGG